jgi:hypothetical protein
MHKPKPQNKLNNTMGSSVLFFFRRVKKNGEKVSMSNNCDNIASNHVFFLLETHGTELRIEKPTLFYLDLVKVYCFWDLNKGRSLSGWFSPPWDLMGQIST